MMTDLMPQAPTDTNAPPATASGVDVTLETFTAEVLEASAEQLVVVDFWSSRCGPCQQLMPVLEKAVAATLGAAKLVKVNVEKEAEVARQLRVQSVPTVYAFWKGQPVDAFMGAIPQAQLDSWLSKLIQSTGAKAQTDAAKGLDYALEQAKTFLESGEIETALSIYQDLESEAPDDPRPMAGAMRCHLKLGLLDEVKGKLDALPDKLRLQQDFASIQAALDLALQATKGPPAPVEEWRAALVKNPDDHKTRFAYALHLYTQNQPEQALDELLEIMRRDRKWNKDAARQQAVKIFEALGQTHDITIQGRKKLSTILFS